MSLLLLAPIDSAQARHGHFHCAFERSAERLGARRRREIRCTSLSSPSASKAKKVRDNRERSAESLGAPPSAKAKAKRKQDSVAESNTRVAPSVHQHFSRRRRTLRNL